MSPDGAPNSAPIGAPNGTPDAAQDDVAVASLTGQKDAGTGLDLDAIERRYRTGRACGMWRTTGTAIESANDVPALIAEVRRVAQAQRDADVGEIKEASQYHTEEEDPNVHRVLVAMARDLAAAPLITEETTRDD